MNILEEIQNCPIEWKELGEVVDTVTSPVKLTKKEYQVTGKIPIVDQGEQFIAGYADNEKYLEKDEYIIFGDHSEHVKYVDFAFVQGADGLKILKPKSGIKAKYIYYCFCNFYKKEGSYKRHWSKARTTQIPIPQSEEIQEKIVQTLDKFTDYVTELTSELTSRKKQYSFYRDKLLSFEDEVYQVEWKTLGEVCEVYDGTHQTPKYTQLGIPFVSVENIRSLYTTEKYISKEDYDRFKIKPKVDDVFMTRIGDIGTCAVVDRDDDLAYYVSLALLRPNRERLNSSYLKYFIGSTHGRRELNKLILHNATPIKINKGDIGKIKIAIPSLEIQSRIVKVLDNFDTVCNDLNIGLPKEIELRQKQYEFFREKLLTFVAEGEYTDSTVQYRQDLIRLLNWVFGPIRVELGQIFNTKNGYTPIKTNLDNWRNGTIPWFRMEDIRENGRILSDSIQHITEGAVKGELFPANSIIIATSATIGYHALVTRKFLANQRFTCLLAKEGISGLFIPNFLYYYCFKLDEFCRQNTLQGNFATVDMTKFKKFKFIIPSIKRQREIISILDHFNTLTTSLSEGLPKEIELRQKQYEYWREQLLNFTR
ncbi:putative type-1 restriction enzyme specificity protein [Streptococcus intermedius]|uniref:restriction endonuclease subunit S n=1 Tax=Streptococcus intermedius TaxID=1338 RepID=UPI000F65DD19|nr:restriction endonuclease subunit S [Streptococcus intermedius]RSJ11196.1 putative type-1 restriction enzyme specificity protein [Streptococcus intermedius]